MLKSRKLGDSPRSVSESLRDQKSLKDDRTQASFIATEHRESSSKGGGSRGDYTQENRFRELVQLTTEFDSRGNPEISEDDYKKAAQLLGLAEIDLLNNLRGGARDYLHNPIEVLPKLFWAISELELRLGDRRSEHRKAIKRLQKRLTKWYWVYGRADYSHYKLQLAVKRCWLLSHYQSVVTNQELPSIFQSISDLNWRP